MSIQLTKGQTRTYKITWRDKATQDTVDLTPYKLYFTVADTLCPTSPAIAYNTDDDAAVFWKDPDQVANKGVSWLRILPAATGPLKAPKTYRYDTWAEEDAENRFPGKENQPFVLDGSVTVFS